MKTTIDINGKPVEIELTPEQIKKIKSQSYDYKDIKTFGDACNFLGIDRAEFNKENSLLPEDVYAYMQLRLICQALNGGEHMDYSDTDEYKYYPCFNSVGSSSGFSYDGYAYVLTGSDVGSRLVYKSREIAEYAGRTFIDIYNKYIN